MLWTALLETSRSDGDLRRSATGNMDVFARRQPRRFAAVRIGQTDADELLLAARHHQSIFEPTVLLKKDVDVTEVHRRMHGEKAVLAPSRSGFHRFGRRRVRRARRWDRCWARRRGQRSSSL